MQESNHGAAYDWFNRLGRTDVLLQWTGRMHATSSAEARTVGRDVLTPSKVTPVLSGPILSRCGRFWNALRYARIWNGVCGRDMVWAVPKSDPGVLPQRKMLPQSNCHFCGLWRCNRGCWQSTATLLLTLAEGRAMRGRNSSADQGARPKGATCSPLSALNGIVDWDGREAKNPGGMGASPRQEVIPSLRSVGIDAAGHVL
jgi:hypothetical protein